MNLHRYTDAEPMICMDCGLELYPKDLCMCEPERTYDEDLPDYDAWIVNIDRILKQCDEFSATVQEGSKLLTEARENLSEALKGISLTGDFAKSGLSTSKVLGTECENGAEMVRKLRPEQPLMLPSAPEILEAERKHYANQHRLEQEYAERFPEE